MDKDCFEKLIMKNEWGNEVAEIVDFECESILPKGENYLSTILRAQVTVLLKTGSEIKRNFIIKKALEGGLDELNKIFNPFKTEIKMFKTVLRHMEALMEEFNDENDLLWGKVYGSNPYDVIIFQDFTESSYSVSNRKDCLNLDQSLLVMRSIGRFHAMSKILLERGVVGPNNFGPHFLYSDSDLCRKMTESALKTLAEVIESSWPSDYKEIAKKIKEQVPIAQDRLIKLGKLEEQCFTVINHGDLWTNNLLFKYSEYDKKPISVKYIDFQVSHYNSYMYDLIYFMYSSIIPSIRRAHIEELLQEYQTSLSSNLEFYGYTKKVPDMTELKSEAERFSFLEFFATTLTYSITTADSGVAMDLVTICDADYQGEFTNPAIFESERYINGIKEDLQALAKRGVI